MLLPAKTKKLGSMMSFENIVYFSKMYQAVPALVPIQCITGGCFVTARRSTMDVVRRNFSELDVRRYQKLLPGLSAGHKALKNADVIVTGSPYRDFLNPYDAQKYMVFHGTYMMMSAEATNKLKHFDKLFLTGPRMEQMFSRADVDVETHVTGYLPFADFPASDRLQKDRILQRLGLDSRRKTIVYTPSRGSIGSWLECAEKIATEIPQEYNLIMRPHPSQALNSSAEDQRSYKKVQSIMALGENAVLDMIECSLPEILSVADLVVSDANSPAEESMFYDVPQLFIETKRFSRKHLEQMGIEQSMVRSDLDQLLTLYECGPSTSGSGSWIGAIEGALANADHYKNQRNDYFSWVFGQRDKNAAKRIATFLI